LSFLKSKSDFNLDGAILLIENNCYAPSVHCSYYSVFQLLKHKFVILKEISYSIFSQNSRNDIRNSHKYLIDEFCLHLHSDSENKLSIFEVRSLKRDIEDLKQFRNESDYDNIQINIEASSKALSLSESILKRLKHI
jgi:uncharacterized protein (UPF0332 family)